MDIASEQLLVALGERSYPIQVTADHYEALAEMFARCCGGRQVAIITDSQVEPLYATCVADRLRDGGFACHTAVVPSGEASKRMEIVERLYDQLFDFNLERSDAVVALGGGVAGDLAGFVAATFKRGLNYVQAPTSLLAMVDSSIGGKTGINHPRGKNMIGAFHQPRLVYADTTTLATLPRRELSCGLAETVKHAVIRDNTFFNWLGDHVKEIRDLEPACMNELVLRNCAIKAAVVSADERESGLRGILNFGHTIGHAIEILKSKEGMLHGEAISLGMVAALQIAVRRSMVTSDQATAIIKLLEAFELPVRADQNLPVEDIYEAMKHDKKVQSGRIRFVLPTTIGDCTFVDDLTETEIRTAIESLMG